jgi:hypothetical protein
MRPNTMDDAIDKVKWAKYTRGLVYNKRETVSKGSVQEVEVAAFLHSPRIEINPISGFRELTR